MESPWFRMTLEMPEVPFRMRPLRPLTDEELERLSARQDVLHIEREPNGELEVRLVGGTIAGAVATDLMCELYAWSDDAGVGRVLPNVGYFLSDGSMRGPRVSWVTEATYAVHKEREGDGFLRGAPPFVIEVVSLQRTPQEWRERMEIWMENGVELGWLFDPSRKTVEVYRAGRAMEERHEPATMCGEGPIAGFVLELGKVWG
ncbi:Uma2 family endonuclease [Granulicella paludicola]|uniref:Uma2 family endonuclease n=1 Tax=Granulicella paludicola TaxID=474951 RepID=UPI0021DF5A31|nr:Uma2 family endonuclease [Granulicella paludicola]